MRRSLLLTIIMVLTLMLGLVGVAGAANSYAPQAAPFQQEEETPTPGDEDATDDATDDATPVTGGEDDEGDMGATPTSPAGLPDTGVGGGLNIALLSVLGAFALAIAGIALLTSGRKSESES